MAIAAGIDLGGTAVNYTFLDGNEKFLIEGLCEYPARSREGPAICLRQITDGLAIAAAKIGCTMHDIAVIGLDSPGPASAAGVFSERGSTNFVHPDWRRFDIREGLESLLARPVLYLNDGNAGALWGHFVLFGAGRAETSISAIVGTGLGGGVIVEGNVVRGRRGFGGELGHVLIPHQSIEGIEGLTPVCNCGRVGDLEALCSLTAIAASLLPYFLHRYPAHELGRLNDIPAAAKRVRGLAEAGDPMCREIFRVQANALGLFFDEMINIFDPDALIVGGGAIETGDDFRQWFVREIRAGMPLQRAEQVAIPIHIMPDGDTAGSRGAAIEALKYARERGLM